jgi:hypothetical protein
LSRGLLQALLASLVVLLALPAALAQGEAKKKKDVKKKEGWLQVEDQLTADLPIYRGQQGKFFKAHPYRMTAGTTYTIDLMRREGGGGGLHDPYLFLEDPTGAVVAQDDDSGGNLNARIVYRAPLMGTYKIIATDLAPNRTGQYTLMARPGGRVGPGGMVLPAPALRTFDKITITAEPLPFSPFGSSSGQAGHGYLEYRFTISNRSADSHRVTLVMPKSSAGRPSGPFLTMLRRTVEVGPEADVSVALLQPDLALYNAGSLGVSIDGVEQRDGLSLNNVPQRGVLASGYHFPPPMLALEILAGDFNLASAVNMNLGRAHGPAGPPSRLASAFRHFQIPALDLAEWSPHWLAYSSYDGLVLTAEQVSEAPAAVREALWRYVECGGALLILGTTKVPDSWQRRQQQKEGLICYYPGFGECFVSAAADLNDQRHWTPERLLSLRQSWEHSGDPWQKMRSITDANHDCPVVDDVSIPVRGLFALMLLFTLGIGPVNLYVLSRRKRRMWLLWTVPAVSAVTCMAVLGFMLVSEGWTGQVRIEGLTVLDQGSHRASTIGWIGYYMPVAPSEGLTFDADTELTPQVAGGRYTYHRPSMAYVLDWTDDAQHLASGAVTARVPAHFVVRRSENRRERVGLHREKDGSLAAVNLLSVPIKQLWLADRDGRIYTASDLPAGPQARLALVASAVAKGTPDGLRELYGRDWLQHYNSLTSRPADYLLPGSYIAALETTPFMEEGLRGAQPRRCRSVVYGIMAGEDRD